MSETVKNVSLAPKLKCCSLCRHDEPQAAIIGSCLVIQYSMAPNAELCFLAKISYLVPGTFREKTSLILGRPAFSRKSGRPLQYSYNN